ncbi:hypothetical protein AB3S75_022829 [Citrus x aurantiifolia]
MIRFRATVDYIEGYENPNCTEKGEIREGSIFDRQPKKASIFDRQPKAVGIGFPSRWREKLIDRPTRAEKLCKFLVNSKKSRNGLFRESLYENFPVLSRMDRETVSDSCHGQDEKVRTASINPNSEFQDPADPRLELIGRRASTEQVVILSLSLRSTHVSRCGSPSSCETTLPDHVNTELLELELDKLLAHINGWPDLKPYNMFGTTAFRSQPHWGDNGGEKHILPGDHQSHDYSVISPNSVPLASRSSSCASSKDGDGDKQPPPNRLPPYGVASSQSEGQLCFPSLDMICLFLGAEVCVAAPLIRYKAGTSLSEAAKTLLFVAKILGFAGFLLCLGACVVQRSRRASRMMTAMGCAASFCGFLSILGMLFPENLMIWLIGALCVLPISAIPFAFKRSV